MANKKHIKLDTDFLGSEDELINQEGCENCKNLTGSSSAFCQYCGRKLNQLHTATGKDKKLKKRSSKVGMHLSNKTIAIITIMIAAVPTIGFVWMLSLSSQDNNRSSTYTAPQANTAPKPTNVAPEPPKLNRTLPNGTVINSSSVYLSGGHSITIDNGSSSDAVVKLVRTSTNKSIYTVYVSKKSEIEISNISDGTYLIYVTQGNDWDSSKKQFNYNVSYYKMDTSETLTTTQTEDELYYYDNYEAWEYTLHEVIGGNVGKDTINANNFNNL